MKPRPERGGCTAAFSLVEMLIVMALIVTMWVMTYGSRQAKYQRVQKQHCQENLQKMYIALQLYANDFNGLTPAMTNATTSEAVLSVLVPRYMADTTVFICPGGRDSQFPSGASLKQEKISYAYYMGRQLGSATEALMSDRQVNTNRKTQGAELFSATGEPPGNNHKKYGGNVMFSDGHIDNSKPAAAFPLDYPDTVTLLNPKP